MAILGTETRSGDFEVADALFAGVPDYKAKADTAVKIEDGMDLDEAAGGEGWVALVSGLEMDSSSASVTVKKGEENENGLDKEHGMMGYSEKEMRLMLLTDWLLGHVGETEVSSI